MQAATLLKDYPDPTDQDINAVMAGNLCRCMTYLRIRKAIKLAAAQNAATTQRRLVTVSAWTGDLRPSRRRFLITCMGAGVMLGFARSLAEVELPIRAAGQTDPASCSNRPSGTASIPAAR